MTKVSYIIFSEITGCIFRARILSSLNNKLDSFRQQWLSISSILPGSLIAVDGLALKVTMGRLSSATVSLFAAYSQYQPLPMICYYRC